MRSNDLMQLLTVINAPIDQMPFENFYEFIGDYVQFVLPDDSRTPFRDFMKKHYAFVEKILEDESDAAILKMKRFFSATQSHLKGRIDEIMLSFESDESSILWEQKGTRKLIYDHEVGEFIEEFEPDAVIAGKKLNLELERQLIDARLEDIIIDLGMSHETGHFCNCKKCGNHFYQATRREKLYCSDKCAKASAQAEYMKRKNK